MAAIAPGRDSELLRYLAVRGLRPGDRLPAIRELAEELGVSAGKLREQLEVARVLGLVEVRPKTGIRAANYAFFASAWFSLRHALALDSAFFEQFEALRTHVEAAFFHEAAELLLPEDHRHLQHLVQRAWTLLQGDPIQIPHAEHREFHLTIFGRLDNTFVRGILEAYWEAYDTVGLSLYADYGFLHEVWTYHEQMVERIVAGDLDSAYRVMKEHIGLVQYRPGLARRPGGLADDAPTSAPKTRRGVVR